MSNKRRLGNAGVTSMELALVMVAFMALLLGITDFARYLITDESMLTLMHTAERKTMIQNVVVNLPLFCPATPTAVTKYNNTTTDISSVAPFLDANQTYLCVARAQGVNGGGTVPQIQITVSYPFTPVWPGLTSLFHALLNNTDMMTETETFTY